MLDIEEHALGIVFASTGRSMPKESMAIGYTRVGKYGIIEYLIKIA
jgi:hypothetical protein